MASRKLGLPPSVGAMNVHATTFAAATRGGAVIARGLQGIAPGDRRSTLPRVLHGRGDLAKLRSANQRSAGPSSGLDLVSRLFFFDRNFVALIVIVSLMQIHLDRDLTKAQLIP